MVQNGNNSQKLEKKKNAVSVRLNTIVMRQLLADCLKYAIEKLRISGDHSGEAGLTFLNDSYEEIADDFLNDLGE